MNRLVLASLLLVPSLAFGADIHVLLDTNGDGKANPCTNPSHDDLYSTDTVTCGGTFDIDGDGTAETIYCNLQAALNAATSCGDSVEIHAGTWDNNDTTPVNISDLCTLGAGKQALMTVKAATGCDTEGERRYVRGAFMASSQDTPIVTLTGDTDVKVAMSVGTTSSDDVRFVQVDHIYFEDAMSTVGCTGSQYWQPVLYIRGNADYLRVTGCTFIGDPGTDSDGDGFTLMSPSECPNVNDFAEDGVTAIGGDDNTQRDLDFVEIDNNRIDMCGFMGVKGMDSGDCCICYRDAWHIHNNTITVRDGKNGEAPNTKFHSEIQHACDWVINGNILYTPETEGLSTYGPGFKFRRGAGSIYIFDNYFQEPNMLIYFQSACHNSIASNPEFHDGRIYIFNNTVNDLRPGSQGFVRDSTSGDASCQGWPLGQEIRSYNNSFQATGAIWNDLIDASGNDETGWEHWTGGSYIGGTYEATDHGGYICQDNLACGAVTAYTQCGGGLTCNAASPGRPLTGAAPWRLTSGSILIGKGTNNPLDQGAGVCSIALWSGHTIDCTKDYDGDSRGTTWDIGADEFTSSPVCGNDVREGAEVCDDTNGDGVDFGTDSCESRGFAGGFLTCTTCTTVTTTNCLAASTNRSILKGVTLQGGVLK